MIKKFAKELEQPEKSKRKSSSNTDENETNEETKVGEKRKRSSSDDSQEDQTDAKASKKRRLVDQETQTSLFTKKPEADVPRAPKTQNYYTNTRRGFTTTLVLPSSIVDNAQSLELKTYLVSQISKAAATFCFNEIVIVSCDKHNKMASMKQDVTTTEFFV